MRTYVRMGPRPFRPAEELDGAIQRGDLEFAITLALEISSESHRPIDLDTALRFLPLVASQRVEEYDPWALRWLARWISETRGATIEQAVEVTGSLADLPSEPAALATIRKAVRAPPP
jgi:hypothetical protein